MGRAPLPAWLRRAVEAALGAALIALAALFGNGLAGYGAPVELPGGLLGITWLAPPVLALAVLPTAYPIALAATRSDALMGAFAAVLLAIDVTLLLAGTRLRLPAAAVELPAGLLVAIAALPAALAAMVAAQVATPFGFGRRAGAWAAGAAAIGTLVVLTIVASVT